MPDQFRGRNDKNRIGAASKRDMECEYGAGYRLNRALEAKNDKAKPPATKMAESLACVESTLVTTRGSFRRYG